MTFTKDDEAVLHWTLSPDAAQAFSSDPTYTGEGTYLIGLDDVLRLSPGRFGLPMGLKGKWDKENTFTIQGDLIGNGGHFRINLIFEDDQVTIHYSDYTESFPKFAGRIAE